MDNFLTSLALCYKSGNLRVGFDSVKESIEHLKAALVLVTCDISEKTEKEINFLASNKHIEARKIHCSMDDVQAVLNKRIGVLAIEDENFAKLFHKQLG